MQTNGFSAGVEPGGLYRKADIQLLLCYVLGSVEEAMPRAILMDIVVGNGMANFFETTEALESLLTAGSVTQDDNELLAITATGKVAMETLRDRLPRTLRERSAKLAIQSMARRRNEMETDVTITDLPHGCSITCAIPDGDAPLMALSLKVGDRLQADVIRDRFLDDSALFYRSVLSILTGRADVRQEDGQTVIHVL